MDLNTYRACFHNGLSDIELKTHPIEIISPIENPNPEDKQYFKINHDTNENKEIASRLTRDVVCNSLHPSLDLTIDVINKKIPHDEIVEDAMLYFHVLKFNEQIDVKQIEMLSNVTPLIEFVVENLTPKDIKNHISTKKLKPEKYEKQLKELIFNPEIAVLTAFYSNEDNLKDTGIKCFDVSRFICLLASNHDVKSDDSIIVGIYEAISFAMLEIANMTNDIEQSPNPSKCIEFVRWVSDIASSI